VHFDGMRSHMYGTMPLAWRPERRTVTTLYAATVPTGSPTLYSAGDTTQPLASLPW